jgi:hypothetical protein
MQNNIYKRLTEIESIAMLQKSELTQTLEHAYKKACQSENSELAASLARQLRNRMLDESDKQMSLDRLKLDTSSAVAFIASLSKIFENDWSKYRQELRDLPLQEGFPFNIKFPASPDQVVLTDEDENEEE